MENQRKRAFTLVEMMAVVVIIGLLAAVIGPKIFQQVGKAEITTAKREIETIKNAITMYRFDTKKLPEDLRDLMKDPDIKNWGGPYLDKKPVDPWDNDYQYRSPGNDGREFDIWSYGPDGSEGGEGVNADIVSWQEETDD